MLGDLPIIASFPDSVIQTQSSLGCNFTSQRSVGILQDTASVKIAAFLLETKDYLQVQLSSVIIFFEIGA